MTVEELSARISLRELHEWAVLSRMEREERDNEERISRVKAQAEANRRQ